MTDVIFLATLIAFFALMVVFVRFCERIVGKDDAVDSATEPEFEAESGTATPEEVPA